MTFGYTNDLKHLLHPYILVLKQGNENPFDFSLMILQITCPEVIKSPTCPLPAVKPLDSASPPELEILKASLAEALLQKKAKS